MTETKTIRLWDLPVRLFHWATVLLVAGLWVTHVVDRMDLHIKLGLAMLFLVTFRILWGVLGSETARFARFVRGPAAIRAYLASGRNPDGSPVVGHNPLGALSVIGLIGILALQVGLGLFASDTDAVYYGPLNQYVSFDRAELLTHLHEFVFNLILLLVAIHLAAIIYYAVKKKDRLIPPMVTGIKTYAEPVRQPVAAPVWRLVIALMLAGVLTYWVGNGGHFIAPPKITADVGY
jgi:cytochrome b